MSSEPYSLIDTPTAVPAGTSRMEALVDARPVGQLDYQVCATCQRGIIHHVQVEPAHRRRGIATSMINEIQRLHPDHTWSTATQIGGGAGAGLWNSLGLTDSSSPVTCRHMRQADGPRDEQYRAETPWSSTRR